MALAMNSSAMYVWQCHPGCRQLGKFRKEGMCFGLKVEHDRVNRTQAGVCKRAALGFLKGCSGQFACLARPAPCGDGARVCGGSGLAFVCLPTAEVCHCCRVAGLDATMLTERQVSRMFVC